MAAAHELTMKPRAIVFAACGVSLALGLFFIFVWSPLPWGWHGIDFYYEDALSLAGGSPFQTMDRVWGYAYFLAGFYRLFGDRPWIPLCAQALANASIPLMIYALVRLEMSEHFDLGRLRKHVERCDRIDRKSVLQLF